MRARERERYLRQHLWSGGAEDAYAAWPTPTTIISDGAYGVGGFPGDPRTADDLAAWYRPHVEAWSKCAKPATTLWFWNTEQGWANVHPLLVDNGWEYVETIVWDKGIAHIAGNVNGDTIRRFPVVTEVCVFYRRKLTFATPDGVMAAKEWLRYEWQRAGLTLTRANEACGVKNAATRKYLTQDWLWYFPPPEHMVRLVDYANLHGDPDGRPYFSLDGRQPVDFDGWAELRDIWRHQHGVTNVWRDNDPADAVAAAEAEELRSDLQAAARSADCADPSMVAALLDPAAVAAMGGAAAAIEALMGAAARSNVWVKPPLHGAERFRGNGKRSAPRVHNPGANAAVHLNQKPLEFMRRILAACTAPGEVVWEPFGGLCSASVAAVEMGREPYAAEPISDFSELAGQRLIEALENRPGL